MRQALAFAVGHMLVVEICDPTAQELEAVLFPALEACSCAICQPSGDSGRNGISILVLTPIAVTDAFAEEQHQRAAEDIAQAQEKRTAGALAAGEKAWLAAIASSESRGAVHVLLC